MSETDRFVQDFRDIVGNYFEGADREACFLTLAERKEGPEGDICAYSVFSEGSVPVTVNAVSRALGDLIGSTARDRDSIFTIVLRAMSSVTERAIKTLEEREANDDSNGA